MSEPVEHYDVVVLGAGIAGLNALAVASKYVGRQGRCCSWITAPRRRN